MSNWKKYKLGDITTWKSGGTPSKQNPDFWNGPIPWVSAKSFNSSRIFDSEIKITKHGLENGSRLAEVDSILLLVRGSGLFNDIPVGIVKKPVAFNQDIKALEVDPKVLRPEFLLYWLISNKPLLASKLEHTGIGAGKFETDIIKNLDIAIPDLETQGSIIDVFQTIDDKIELNNQINKNLEALAQALFKQWFVDFEFPNENGQPYKSSGGEMVESELGMIPKGWQVKSIAEVAKNIQYGFTQSSSPKEIGPKFLRITDIQGGVVSWDNVPYCEATPSEMEKYRIIDHDIFIARTGASTGENIYVINPPDAVFASYLIRVQFDNASMACYVGKAIRRIGYFEYIETIKGGSAQPNANAKQLTDFDLVFPNNGLLEEYYLIVDGINQKINLNGSENQNLSQLRNTILPKLILGELEVSGT